MATLAEDAARRCVCRRCEKRCDRCTCPRPVRVYKSTPGALRSDRKRVHDPDRERYQRERKRDLREAGQCIDCMCPQRPGSSRCEACLARVAARVWRGKIAKMILSEQAHRDDPRVKRCVSAWVKANEPELRELTAAERPPKVSAANAAREKWRERADALALERPELTPSQRRELAIQGDVGREWLAAQKTRSRAPVGR